MCAKEIEINIPNEQNYTVRIGANSIETLGSTMRQIPGLSQGTQVFIISDSNVAPLYMQRTEESLKKASYEPKHIVLKAGEETKNLSEMSTIWQTMARTGLKRDAIVIALGGGVIGDMAGFAAAAFMRGIPVVQCPTTLLAMVDSSVGGKTGVNLPEGKNLVGNFKQPAYVCADTTMLQSLNNREWTCGLGEIAKSAIIDSKKFFLWLNNHAIQIVQRETDVVEEAIANCVTFKANVVIHDKEENCGMRECLNFGHTMAHAIEALAGYGRYSHGHAVAEGMRFALHLSCECGCNAQVVQNVLNLFDKLGLTKLSWKDKPNNILDSMKRDKKVRNNVLRFVLLQDIGKWKIVELDDQTVVHALETYYSTA